MSPVLGIFCIGGVAGFHRVIALVGEAIGESTWLLEDLTFTKVMLTLLFGDAQTTFLAMSALLPRITRSELQQVCYMSASLVS